MTTLSSRQVRQFHDDGYLVLERAVDSSAIESIRRAAAGIVDAFDIERHRSVFSTRDNDAGRDAYFMASSERVHCFLEADALDADGNLLVDKPLAINKIGHALHDRVPAFADFCRLPVFAGALDALGVETPRIWQTMYIFKQPSIGGEVRWHQDASYLVTDPPQVTGFWIAVDDARLDNGCLQVAPGWHRGSLRERFEVAPGETSGVLHRLDDTPWPAAADAVPLEVPAGSVVLLHDMLPHYSAHNASAHSRHAFTVHAAPASARWSPRNWLQRPALAPFVL